MRKSLIFFIIIFIIIFLLIFSNNFLVIKKEEKFSFPNSIDLIQPKNLPCQSYDSNENNVRTGIIDENNKCFTYGFDNSLTFPEVKSYNKGNYAIIDPFRSNSNWKLTEEYNNSNFINKLDDTFISGGQNSEGDTQYLCYARITDIYSKTDGKSSPDKNDINKSIPGTLVPSEKSFCNVALKDSRGIVNLYDFPNFRLLKTTKRSGTPSNAYLTALYNWKKVNNSTSALSLMNKLSFTNRSISLPLIPQLEYEDTYKNSNWYSGKTIYTKPLLEYTYNFDTLTKYDINIILPTYKVVEQVMDFINYYIDTYKETSNNLIFTVNSRTTIDNYTEVATIIINNPSSRMVTVYEGTNLQNGRSWNLNDTIKNIMIPIIEDNRYFTTTLYKNNEEHYKNCIDNNIRYINQILPDLHNHNNTNVNISDLRNFKIIPQTTTTRATLIRISEQIYDFFNNIRTKNINIDKTSFYCLLNSSSGYLTLFNINVNINLNNDYNITISRTLTSVSPTPSGTNISFNVFSSITTARYIPLTSWSNYLNNIHNRADVIVGIKNDFRASITNSLRTEAINYYNNFIIPSESTLVTIDDPEEITYVRKINGILNNLYTNRIILQIKDFIKYYINTSQYPLQNISFITYTKEVNNRNGYILWTISSTTSQTGSRQVSYTIVGTILSSGSLSNSSSLINIDPAVSTDLIFRELVEIRLINYNTYLYDNNNKTYRFNRNFYENKMIVPNSLYKVTSSDIANIGSRSGGGANSYIYWNDSPDTTLRNLRENLNLYKFPGGTGNINDFGVISNSEDAYLDKVIYLTYRAQIGEWISYYYYLENNINKYNFVFLNNSNTPILYIRIATNDKTTLSAHININLLDFYTSPETLLNSATNIATIASDETPPRIRIYNRTWFNTVGFVTK